LPVQRWFEERSRKKQNESATAFWRKVIGRYTAGTFDEQLLVEAAGAARPALRQRRTLSQPS
jgi:hypothetical protein